MKKKLFVILSIFVILLAIICGPYLFAALIGLFGTSISLISLIYSAIKKNRKTSLISIVTLTISIILFFTGGSRLPKINTKRSPSTKETSLSTNQSSISSSDSSDKEKLILTLDNTSLESDIDGLVTISGITEPSAQISLSSDSKGEEITADSEGRFKILYKLSSQNEKRVRIISKLNDEKVAQTIKIVPSSEYISILQSEEAIDQQKSESSEREFDEKSKNSNIDETILSSESQLAITKLNIFEILNVEGRHSKNEKDGKSFISIGINKENDTLDLKLTPQTIKISLEKFRDQNYLSGVSIFSSTVLIDTNNDLRVSILNKEDTFFVDSVDEDTEKEILLEPDKYYYIRINPGGSYDLNENGYLYYTQ